MEQCQIVRFWRNQARKTLRTPYPLTEEQQDAFYMDVVCNPHSPHRYWACIQDTLDREHDIYPGTLLGMGGLTFIQWENRIAEISLILDPYFRGMGLGKEAVDLILAEGFDRMGLKTIFGECYCTHEGVEFWKKITQQYKGYETVLPNRKFWSGRFWDSLYFSIDADDWRNLGDSA